LATRRTIGAATGPEWEPERSLRAIQTQLKELTPLKAIAYQVGRPKETSWKQVTEAVLRRAFSSDSQIITNFSHASSAGSYSLAGMSQGRMQANYLARIAAYEIALTTAIADLKMSMPEEEVQGAYESGEEYAFCRDLRTLMQLAQTETLVIDPYMDPNLFDVYVDALPLSVGIQVLTSTPKANVQILAQKFASGRPNFELRTASKDLHDRVVFVDDRCWVIGQSIKDAARQKPTYIVEHSEELMRKLYQPIWDDAASLVKS
jgi:hypothetical protein